MANNLSTTWCPINDTVTNGSGIENEETLEYAAHSEIYMITLGIICIVGISGNLLVLLCFVVEKKLRTVSNLLIGYLSFIDFLNCSLYLPVHLLALKIGLNSAICNILVFVNPLFPIMSLHTQFVISVNRYVLVTKSQDVYRTWFSSTLTPIFLGLLQCLDMLILYFIPAILANWQTIRHDSTGFCLLAVEFEEYFILTAVVYGSVASFVPSIFLYAKLIWFVKKGPAAVVSTKRRDIKVSLLLFIILVLFLISFIIAPVLVYFSFIFTKNPVINSILWSAGFCVIWLNVCINPILYGFRIRDFKRVYRKILCPCWNIGNNAVGMELSTTANMNGNN